MQEIEIIEKRNKREKHFLQEDGTIKAILYDDDIHYLKDGVFEEIDNTLIRENGYYRNIGNNYSVKFFENINKGIIEYELDNHYINFKLLEKSNSKIIVNSTPNSEKKLVEKVIYKDVLQGIDFRYDLLPSKIKESIIINNKESIINSIIFLVETDFELKLNEDNSISGLINNEVKFNINTPYIIDAGENYNYNIKTILKSTKKGYELILEFDKEWLLDENRSFPVIVDPTITNSGSSQNVIDTYIYENDTNVSRGEQDILKAGVERINGSDVVYRSLLKFELPTIGTGSQIVDARLKITGYPVYYNNLIYNYVIMAIHELTTSWTENGANWNNMHNNYNPKVECCFYATRSIMETDGTISTSCADADITSLVKKWYTDLDNNGIMIKASNEVYDSNTLLPAFFSKNNTVSGTNPKPLLQITYRNQNGLESYLDYEQQKFTYGNVNVNTYNGNLVGVFNVGATIFSKMPIDLNVVYNTNDVILEKNIGYGIGVILNYEQTLKTKIIENKEYIEYVDGDGTIHYFSEKIILDLDQNGNWVEINNTPGVYYDEDGLSMTITLETGKYILKTKTGAIFEFSIVDNVGYLTKIIDTATNEINIYRDSNNLIDSIVDSYGDTVTITRGSNEIVITSPNCYTTLTYQNNKLISIAKPSGTMYFEYNNLNIISKVIDIIDSSVTYEYYDQSPYRVRKITTYGLENTLSTYEILDYKFNCTVITRSDNKKTNILFNNFGNAVSKLQMSDDNTPKDSYALGVNFGDDYRFTNKILSEEHPVKYVNNFLRNTSFENTNDIQFSGDVNTTLSISNDFSSSGDYSLCIQTDENSGIATYEVDVEKGKYYTFSCDAKSSGNLQFSLSYTNDTNECIEIFSEQFTNLTDFEREDVSIFYPSNATDNLKIKIYLSENNTTYIDNVQLEYGEVANKYNLIENSDFTKGLDGWIFSGPSGSGVVSLSDGTKALKICMNPEEGSSLDKTFNIKGNKDDVYYLGFWYKNSGIPLNYWTYNMVMFNMNYTNLEYGKCALQVELNSNCDEWQFFSFAFVAEADFDGANLYLTQNENANELLVTDFYLFKDHKQKSFNYDDNYNLVSAKSFNDTTGVLKYDDKNMLIKVTDTKGKNIIYEYDNEISDRVIRNYTEKGSECKYDYDENGNILYSKVTIKNIFNNIETGNYKFRLLGTNKYINFKQNSLVISNNQNISSYIFNVEKQNDNTYCIRLPIIGNKYLIYENNNLGFKNNLSNEDYALFEFVKNEDNSYNIKIASTDYYLKNSDTILTVSELVADDKNFKFYLEDSFNNFFVENKNEYSSNGKTLISTVDSNFNKIRYNINQYSGNLNSIMDKKDNYIGYNYDVSNRLLYIDEKGRNISFGYKCGNLISGFSCGHTNYSIAYDNFLRVVSFSVALRELIRYQYKDNYNKLISKVTYGNNDVINYQYDDFNRLSVIEKQDDTYECKYNNYGLISKIISDNGNLKIDYDVSGLVRKYVFNDLQVKYNYDDNANIIYKKYSIDSENTEINTTLDSDDYIQNTTFNGHSISYQHDALGRIVGKSIDNINNTNYKYVTNGKRTTLLIKEVNDDTGKYVYKYDEYNNITHIYFNNNLIKKYYYDKYNQLIKEKDFENNELIVYKYDDNGNMLYSKKLDLLSYNLKEKQSFKYEDISWKDKLTSYNGLTITYDEIGNPTSYDGNQLTWINGKELSRFENNNDIITYKYNESGFRTSKTINGVEVKYYIEGNRIVLEKRNNNKLVYVYDMDGELIGLKYNNIPYFYIKNIQNDIIAIVDSTNQIVAKYKYDSWGKIINITDENGVDISDDETNIANINPFRYRGYYYDIETDLYYLGTRYYNPKWNRFLNADRIIQLPQSSLGYNLFIYAGNNPINNYDYAGKSLKKILKSIAKKANKIKKKVQNFFQKVKKAFTFEAGIGFGVSDPGIDVNNKSGLDAGFYKDFGFGVSNGQTYQNTTTSGGITYDFNDDISFGFGFEVNHIEDSKINENGSFHDNIMVMPWEIWDCPNTSKEWTIGTEYHNVSADNDIFDPNSRFVGIEISPHFVIGGHLKIGFNLGAFDD